MYPSSPLERRIDFEVEDAEGHEGHDAGDYQLGQVVVVENVVLQKSILPIKFEAKMHA